MREATTLVAYLAALGCATYLCAHGMLPRDVVVALLGAAVPTYWQHTRRSHADR